MVYETPPQCQNIMFSNSSSSEHPYLYQPMVRVPARTSTLTLGEVGASVDLLRTQLSELFKRMEVMESTVSEFKTSVSNDVFLLKSTLFEHSNELLNVRDVVNDTHNHVKQTHSLIETQNTCINGLKEVVSRSNTLYEKQQKKIATNVDLGIIRRRLSKMEDFTNEFYEQFQSFKCVKDILFNLSDHIEECDRDISFMLSKNNQYIGYDDDGINSSSILTNYFSNYSSDHDDCNDDDRQPTITNSQTADISNQDQDEGREDQDQDQEIVIEYNDIEKL
jgi:archaellum component FlaC